MDPEEAAYAIAAFEKGNLDEALLALEDLNAWFSKGGFPLKSETQAKLMGAFVGFLTSSDT
jgi:hypothetical protein